MKKTFTDLFSKIESYIPARQYARISPDGTGLEGTPQQIRATIGAWLQREDELAWHKSVHPEKEFAAPNVLKAYGLCPSNQAGFARTWGQQHGSVKSVEPSNYPTPQTKTADFDEEAAMEAAWERSGEPHPRDVLKREYDEAQKRPRNEAMEKWGELIGEKIRRDLEQGGTLYRDRSRDKQRDHDEPDLDLG